MRRFFRNYVTTTVAAAALAAACRGAAVPNQVLTKSAPIVAPVTRANGPWPYHAPAHRQQFVVDQRALIAIHLDTTTRTDTVSTHAEIAFSGAPVTNAVNGDVTAFLVRSGDAPPASPPGVTTPFAVRAEYGTHASRLNILAPAESIPCSSAELSAAQSLRDLWFRPPDTLRVGTTWEDSASYAVCRDGIPLHLAVQRVFRVVNAGAAVGGVRASISRTTRAVIDGTGTQFGEAVRVNGSGNGQLTYTLDLTSGEVLSANGSSTLDFVLQSRLRTQSVQQTVEVRVLRR